MANADLTQQQTAPHEGEVSIDGTMANNLISLPPWASSLNVYLADATDGTWGYTSTGARPLPGQQWIRLWSRPRKGPDMVLSVYVASGSGNTTLHYLVS